MKIAKFSVACTAYYKTELEIPNSVPDGQELAYIKDHLSECSTANGLEWLDDLDPEEAVTEDDILEIYEE